MILLIIAQLLIWHLYIQFFNKNAYDSAVWGRNKVYINRFLQIIGYLLCLIPGIIIVQIFIIAAGIAMFEYPHIDIEDKKWYKWLFENPNENN